MKLASFDIFDTVLIRRCGKPGNIFYLLAHRLYPEDRAKREDFLHWRLHAERCAASRFKRDSALADIYDNPDAEGFAEYTPQELANTEKAVEAENLTVNPAVAALIGQKREAGYVICFISDMYLDSRFLSMILRREGCLADNEKVYVSCEHNARKSTGSLFRIVREALNPAEWIHYGDNIRGDIKIPGKLGIASTRIDSSYSDAEQQVQKGRGQRFAYPQSILSGLSRSVRMATPGNPEVALAADFVAPAYVPYALFILKEARKQGIKRLYFLSRDSFILMKALQQVAPSDIELRYLFVSRKSLLLPYLTETTPNRFLKVIDKNTLYRKYVDAILSQLSTTREELKRVGIEFAYNHITNKAQEQDFLDKIFTGVYLPILQQKAKEAKRLLAEYFAQEGLFDNTDYAMVDVGWLGTSRLMINQLLRDAGHRETLFFYYGTRNDVLPTKYGRYISYFPTGQLSTEATALLENYYSASPYPTTIGYCKDAGRIIPVFPAGMSYADSAAIQANVCAVEQLIARVTSMKFITDDVLYHWAETTLDTIVSLKATVDCSPIARHPENGEPPIARRLAASELLSLLLFGGRVTQCDRMSIYMTCASCLRAPLIKHYELLRGVRGYIYRRFVYRAK